VKLQVTKSESSLIEPVELVRLLSSAGERPFAGHLTPFSPRRLPPLALATDGPPAKDESDCHRANDGPDDGAGDVV